MEVHRLFGVVSLAVLLLLCFYSLEEAPRRWDNMPPLSYLAGNILDYEGVWVYADGVVMDVTSDGNVTGFVLSPDPVGMFGSMPVKTLNRISGGTNVVCASGWVKGGTLLADDVIVKRHPITMMLLNILGLTAFIYLSLREWGIVSHFPFIKPRENA